MSAKDVANYFLSKEDADDSDISNLKLQKLVYYAQAFNLAVFDEPLFEEDFKAWQHGPVCPSLYQEYKNNGRNPIPPADKFDASVFSPEQKELLDEVYEEFGQYGASKLRNMTHAERPWLEQEATAGTIDKESMREFYKTMLK